MATKANKRQKRLTLNLDGPTSAELRKRAEVDGRSLSNEAERAIKYFLSDTSYEDLALVILEAAERIRAQEKAS
jgi:hypothetical protein